VPCGRVNWEPGAAAAALVPVPGQGGVVRRRPPGDHAVPDDLVDDLLLQLADLVVEGVDAGRRREPGLAPGLFAERL
jgi:hypothetical protein